MADVLVLGYHAVSHSWRSALSVTPANLERQLQTLVRHGYRGARFHEAVSSPAAGKRLVVTFDDAYRSVGELALPILASLDLPGTVFVATNFGDGRQLAHWPGVDGYHGGPDEGELAVMSWQELGELGAGGWEIGSHTRSHPHLTQLGEEALREELEGSRSDCERALGVPCHSIAYPYGDTDPRVVQATACAGYHAAAGLPRAHRLHGPDPLNWPRIGVFYGDGHGRFRLKVSPASRRLRALISAASGPGAPTA